MKKILSFLVLAFVLSLSACQYQRNNTIDQKDFRAGDERIYGVSPDSSAYQLKNKYEVDPKMAAKADEIKTILYP